MVSSSDGLMANNDRYELLEALFKRNRQIAFIFLFQNISLVLTNLKEEIWSVHFTIRRNATKRMASDWIGSIYFDKIDS